MLTKLKFVFVFEFFVQFLDACKAFLAEKAVLKASAMLQI